MKCTIPEISWHNREPVLSVDIHPIEKNFYRLASGGSDTLILIWQLKILENGAVHVEMLSELTRHQRAVNCVKWSPNGVYLASGDDDANVIIWQLKTDNIPLLEGDVNDKEIWIVYKIFRGHKEDIYDICWSPDSTKLLTGSVDNSAILWNVTKGKAENIISDHKSFVQGVAWDPKNQYIATLSSDRICRVFDQNGRRVKARIGRGFLPVSDKHILYGKDVKYFHDDTFKTFFRRLTFSPDGSFLVVPSGSVETEESKNAFYATYIFTMDQLKQPVAVLPTAKQCSIVVKCCPILYELRTEGPKPVIDLPYRMIIALATDSDVILYDTQQLSPFAHLQNIHYTRLTDLTWSLDGLLLAASSTDGFITLVTFEQNELGTQYFKEESDLEESILNISGCEELEKDDVKTDVIQPTVVEVKPKKPSFLEQWAIKGSKRKAEEQAEKKISPKEDLEIIDLTESPVKKTESDLKINDGETKRGITKRITPIRLGSPKRTKSVELNSANEVNTPQLELSNTVEKGVALNRVNPIKDGTQKRINPIKVNDVEPKEIKPFKIDEIPCPSRNSSNKDITVTDLNSITIRKRIRPSKVEDTNSKTNINIPLNTNQQDEEKANVIEINDDIESRDKIDRNKTETDNDKINKHTSKESTDELKTDLEKTELQLKAKILSGTSVPIIKLTKLLPDFQTNISTSDKNEKKIIIPLEKLTEISKLNSVEKKSPGSTKLIAVKRKPKDIPPTKSSKMSLLNFFKPKVTPEKVTAQTKSEQILIQKTVVENAPSKEEIKISTSSLFKKSNLKIKEPPPRSSLGEENASDAWCKEKNNIKNVGEEDTCEFPEDFNLQIEDSIHLDGVENINADTKDITEEVLPEKEKTDPVLDKHVELLKTENTHRRIPLITLSSPKNKKKKP